MYNGRMPVFFQALFPLRELYLTKTRIYTKGASEQHPYCREESSMKTPLALSVLVSIGTLPLPLFAKAKTISDDLRPPPIETISSAASLPESFSDAIVARATIPRGPNDLVRDYEAEMEAVSRRLTGELASISQAAERSEITGEQAGQISKERYQVAIMQFQLLIVLHANLEGEIDRTRRITQKDSTPARAEVSAVVALPFSSLQLNPTLTQYLQLTPSQAAAIEEVMSNERRNFEPMMAELRATSQKLFLANQQGPTNGKDVHALTNSQATILSELIVANSRMQAKIYAILDARQRKKLDHLKQAGEISVVGEE
jgi:hypothetical protein